MTYNPGVSFFIPFHELDPSRGSQCIYFTQKGARCRWSCQESDNRQAIVLHETIHAISIEAVSLDLLEEYVLCNCCRSGRAQHRDRIEDVGLLTPLALRWQDEIRRNAADQFNHRTSSPAPQENIFSPYTYTTPATPIPSHTTTLYTPTAGPSYYQGNVPTSSSINSTPCRPITSSSCYQYDRDLQPLLNSHFNPSEANRYDLRPREANVSTNSTFTTPMSIHRRQLSEFRPHKAYPLYSDSVSRKILDPLEDRDFETGSLYIFNRASSPGHVKIGWTANSISRRLEDWSKCGYNPNLLSSLRYVPHAQRVETLTHHELIKEWRRERMCKAPWCRKSHQEWFEISEERAAQVLSDWADFMKRAAPYDSEGWLKNWWREVVERMDENGEVVTAKKLLRHYEESLLQEATLVEGPVDLGHAPKIEEVVGFGFVPKVGRLETTVRLLPIEEPVRPKERAPLKNEALPKQIPLVNIPSTAEKQPKNDQLCKTKPLPKTEPLFKTESLFTTESLFKTEPLFKTESLFKTGPLFKNEPLSRNELLSITELLSPTHPQCKNKPPCERSPPEKTTLFNIEPLPKTQFLFTAQPPSKNEPLTKTGPLFKAESLFRIEPLPKSEPVCEEVSAPKIALVKVLLPEQIPLPPSPLLQPTTFSQDTFSSHETKPGPRTGTEDIDAIATITNSDSNITSSNAKINTSAAPSTPTSPLATTLPSATPSKVIPPQTNTHTSTDTGTSTKSLSLNFSDPSSEPNPSESSATSASPKPKAEPAPDSPAPPLTEMTETLLTLSTDEQEKVAETLTSTTQHQQNAGGDVQAESESGLLGCDGQTVEEEIKSHNQDESTATEEKSGIADGWDEEVTLVEDQISRSLDTAALKNIDGLINDISAGKVEGVLKGLGGLKVFESEASLVGKVVA